VSKAGWGRLSRDVESNELRESTELVALIERLPVEERAALLRRLQQPPKPPPFVDGLHVRVAYGAARLTVLGNDPETIEAGAELWLRPRSASQGPELVHSFALELRGEPEVEVVLDPRPLARAEARWGALRLVVCAGTEPSPLVEPRTIRLGKLSVFVVGTSVTRQLDIQAVFQGFLGRGSR
jgi:hypothetical protein